MEPFPQRCFHEERKGLPYQLLVEDGHLLNYFVLGCTAENQRCLPKRKKSRPPVVLLLKDLFALLPSVNSSHTSFMKSPKGSFRFHAVCAKSFKFAQQNKINLYSQPNHMNLVNSLDMALLCFSASRSEPEIVKVERVVNIWYISPRYLVAHVLIVNGSALLIIDPLTCPGGLLVVSRPAPPEIETSVIFALVHHHHHHLFSIPSLAMMPFSTFIASSTLFSFTITVLDTHWSWKYLLDSWN